MASLRIDRDPEDTPEQIALQLLDLSKRCAIETKCEVNGIDISAYPIDVDSEGPLLRWHTAQQARIKQIQLRRVNPYEY